MSFPINRTVLMSGADFFDDRSPINPYMNPAVSVNVAAAQADHQLIKDTLERAGINAMGVPAPPGCQDGVYTANWARVRGDMAVLARLPDARKAEEDYALKKLSALGKTVVRPPGTLRFSGQGDALPCGEYLFAGQTYRSDPEAQQFAAEMLGYSLVQLQTIPLLGADNRPAINQSSKWPDSHFYDIDLALAVITPGLIAWCPEAFVEDSQRRIRRLRHIEKIEVSLAEAMGGFACNLVSTGKTVIMSDRAPGLQAAIEARGLSVITPSVSELTKGGGFIRCTTLTLDNA
jgi:N-dimethylarginine dimethylaminohydrolase